MLLPPRAQAASPFPSRRVLGRNDELKTDTVVSGPTCSVLQEQAQAAQL